MEQRGFTLIELLVILSIISALLITGGLEYAGWVRKYRSEHQIRALYSDLLAARLKARAGNRDFLVVFDSATPRRYDVYVDADQDRKEFPDPDDVRQEELSKDYGTSDRYLPFKHNLSADPLVLRFNRRGLVNRLLSIHIPTEGNRDVEYDCVKVFWTRIKLGKMSGQNCLAR